MASSLWLLGVALRVLGSTTTNFGVNVQKYAALKNAARPVKERRSYFKQPKYLLGLAFVILGSIGDATALPLAPQSIIAPIGAISLVSNLFFAKYFLKSTLTRLDVAAVLLIVIGAVTSVSFGAHKSQTYDVDTLLEYSQGNTFIGYACFITIALLAMYGASVKLTPLKERLIAAEDALATASPETRQDRWLSRQSAADAYTPWIKTHRVLSVAMAGLLGAQSVLFTKATFSLVRTSFEGDMQLDRMEFGGFVAGTLFFIFTQLHFLALALKYFDALFVVPVFQCVLILSSSIGGAIFFQELTDFSTTQWIMFPLGIAITLSGVFLLSRRTTSTSGTAGAASKSAKRSSSATGRTTVAFSRVPMPKTVAGTPSKHAGADIV